MRANETLRTKTRACGVQVVLSFEEGGIPKVTGNRLAVTREGAWLLPFWREAGGHCTAPPGPPLHGTPGLLVSRNQVLYGYLYKGRCERWREGGLGGSEPLKA
jgi:hypothetical protein